MNRTLIAIILLISSISSISFIDVCFALPISDCSDSRIIQWGETKYLPGTRIPHGFHDYMVFYVPIETDVKSYSEGIVSSTSYDSLKFGHTITIQHDSNIVSFYGHLNTTFVTVGQKVDCGTIIGKSGNSGLVAAPALYFFVTENNISIDPTEKIK